MMGAIFEKLDLNVDAGLNDVFVRKDDIWIVGDAGTILLSTDGGQSFDTNESRGRGSSKTN